jgi:hypothetical protein
MIKQLKPNHDFEIFNEWIIKRTAISMGIPIEIIKKQFKQTLFDKIKLYFIRKNIIKRNFINFTKHAQLGIPFYNIQQSIFDEFMRNVVPFEYQLDYGIDEFFKTIKKLF